MWPALLTAIFGIIDKTIPDPAAAAAQKLEVMKMQATKEGAQLEADTRLAMGQSDTNKAEAASTNLFVAGWRPAVGWICALALGFKYIGGPLLVVAGSVAHVVIVLPAIDSADLMPLLYGMLGLGGMRMVEKIKGVA